MANACFRCRTSIPSGGTFCRQCQSAVSLGEAGSETTPGWWKAAALGAFVVTGYLAASTVSAVVGVDVPAMLTGAVLAVGMVSFFAGFYLDARAVRGRPDLAASPSDWYLTAALFLSLFVVTIPFVALHYLYRRRQRIGLAG